MIFNITNEKKTEILNDSLVRVEENLYGLILEMGLNPESFDIDSFEPNADLDDPLFEKTLNHFFMITELLNELN